MQKEEAKQKIRELVVNYEKVKASRSISKYTEEETKKDFIEPLFEALGWKVRDKSEVTAEEVQSGGRIDYGFYLDGRLKFNVEAKSLKSDLNREDYADQAVKYSWNKGAVWAILTDFESLKVFNAQIIDRQLADKLYFEIPYSDYLKRFDQLWLLSKESFQTNLLDQEAGKVGKMLQRVSVGALLYKDFEKCRELLTHDLDECNPGLDKDDLDEGVQKLLDRLIFLRVAEDRGIEGHILLELARNYDEKGGHKFQSMIGKFRELDDIYNSDLFSRHPFEKWEEYGGATERVIRILYGKPGYYEYDFKAMPADVLGGVYENYLGYRLEKSKKGLSVSKDAKKRKEHGIYYTPTFIVDYIVKNTLKPVLDKCKTIADLKKIKVLDPACGSGSFLIKALEIINDKYIEFGNRGDTWTKLDILLNNIYGVDLDPQAVEIARLNLLINALDKRIKLPSLDRNIRNGNSLISGTDEELRKYFGKNFRDKKPFNWKEEFPEVFKQGGFNVVIGNPPYVDSESMAKNMPEDREYLNDHYSSAKGNWDLFCVFIEQAMNLCKVGGFHSFILPNKLISANYARGARQILDSNHITLIRDYSATKVFDVAVYPIVYIVQKSKPGGEVLLENVVEENGQQLINSYMLDSLNLVNGLWSIDDKGTAKSPNFEIRGDTNLGSVANVAGAATVAEAYILKDLIKEGKKYKIVNSGTIDRYKSLWGVKPMRYLGNNYLNPSVSDTALENLAKNRLSQTIATKVIMAGMTLRPECMLDKSGSYLAAKSTTVIMNSKYDLRIILGILNSRLIYKFLKNKFKGNVLQGGYLRLGPPEIRQVPMPNFENASTKQIIELVDKMCRLADTSQKEIENSNKWKSLKSDIEKVDKKIDEEVYKLYGLTQKEIEMIEHV